MSWILRNEKRNYRKDSGRLRPPFLIWRYGLIVYIRGMWLGNSLRQRRQTIGWSIEEASKQIGISYSYLNKIELNLRAPTMATLRDIAATYKVPMWVFLFCSDDGIPIDRKQASSYKAIRAQLTATVKEFL